jgi:hypothetical protein
VAREARLEMNGLEARSIRATIALDFQSKVEVALREQESHPIEAGGEDQDATAWKLQLQTREVGTGKGGAVTLLDGIQLDATTTGHLVRETSVEKPQALSFSDALVHFREYAPEETVTRRSTTLHKELKFLGETLFGTTDLQTQIQDVEIPRIDYTVDGGYLAPLSPYLEPWEPLFAREGAFLAVYSQIEPNLGIPFVDASAITPRDVNDFEYRETRSGIVTTVKLTYQETFGVSGTGRCPTPEDVEYFPDEREDGAGNLTRTSEKIGYLHEDPNAPERRTRPVPLGQVVERFRPRRNPDGSLFAGDRRVSRIEDTIHYEDDYRKPVGSTRTVGEMVDRPVIGSVWEEACESIETVITYAPDPFDPVRREMRVAEIETRTGLQLLKAQMALTEASRSKTVDTRVESSDQVIPGPITTRAERYQAVTEDAYRITGSHNDDIRRSLIDSWSRLVPGRQSVTHDLTPKVEYITRDTLFKRRVARTLDASAVGPEIGRYIANRILDRSGQPERTVSFRVVKRGFGTLKVGHELKPLGFGPADGPYIIVRISYSQEEGSPHVIMRVEALQVA